MQLDQFIGKQIGDFLIQERIGRGGMATVYRAYQAAVDRQVALKLITLTGDTTQHEDFKPRFEQEARLVAALEHSHIVPVIDFGLVNDEYAFLAMRLLRGGSLSSLLALGPLPLERAIDIFTEIGAALAYAHSRGVIHRDLKPSNILLDDSGDPYLTDFGLAKLVEASVELTKTGHIVGTPTYMSPEQLRGDPIDHRSDIYSMGVVLYHMLTGQPPFAASETNVVSVIYQHLEKQPPPPRSLNPNIPEAIEAIILRALLKDPRDRYQRIADMVADLNAATGRRGSTTTAPAIKIVTSTHEADKATGQMTTAIPLIKDAGEAAPPAEAPAPSGRSYTNLIAGIIGVLMIAALAFALLDLLGGNFRVDQPIPTPTPTAVDPGQFTVIPGEVGTAEQAVPTHDEVIRAATRLGQTGGFIAYLGCTRQTEYHAAQAREMGDFAAAYELPYRVYDADTDAYQQVTQIDQARTDGAAALILCPLDMSLLADALESAQTAGIPLVFMASNIDSYGGVLMAGDDYQMGLLAGRAAGEIAPGIVGDDLRVLVLGFPDLPVIVIRANGLVEGLQAIVPEAVIAANTIGGTPDNGRESVARALADGLDFNVILSINDAGAYGAIEALAAAGIGPDEVVIASVDAETLARQYIADDYYLRASVVIDREGFSRAAINATVRLLAGATLPETLLVPPGEAVTAATLAEQTPEPTVSVEPTAEATPDT